jgi:uncharacterized protein (DUF433 family)
VTHRIEGIDPRDVATYGIAEAAHYMRLAPSTLREWVSGEAPVIRAASSPPPTLSFWNLVEAYVLAALRRHHRVPLQRVRKAVRYVEHEMGTERPLVEQEFLTNGLDLFVESYGKLVNASSGGQTEIRSLLEASLRRVDRDTRGLAQRLFPWVKSPDEARSVEIDSRRAFGKLVVSGTGIPTAIIADRFVAGDSTDCLADDYGLTESQVEAALRWEIRDRPE